MMGKQRVERRGNVVYLSGPIEEPMGGHDEKKTGHELLKECSMDHLLEVTGLTDLVNLQKPKLRLVAGGAV